MGFVDNLALRVELVEWAMEELEKGNRIKASKIQKVFDRHKLKFNLAGE